MSGPTKIPSLILASLNAGNFSIRYLKAALSLSRAFTSCLMRPSLMCRGGNITLCLSTKGRLLILLVPGTSTSRSGQSFQSYGAQQHYITMPLTCHTKEISCQTLLMLIETVCKYCAVVYYSV